MPCIIPNYRATSAQTWPTSLASCSIVVIGSFFIVLSLFVREPHFPQDAHIIAYFDGTKHKSGYREIPQIFQQPVGRSPRDRRCSGLKCLSTESPFAASVMTALRRSCRSLRRLTRRGRRLGDAEMISEMLRPVNRELARTKWKRSPDRFGTRTLTSSSRSGTASTRAFWLSHWLRLVCAIAIKKNESIESQLPFG